jgi:hypothetical protein
MTEAERSTEAERLTEAEKLADTGPEGTNENSPPFQRRVGRKEGDKSRRDG